MKIKRTINKILASTNIQFQEKTNKQEVLSLIEKLHPKKTKKPLIRMGPNGDGGYLLPDDLENIEACFSPGVDQVSGFEEDCSRAGMKLFLADKSVDFPPINLPKEKFNFIKKFIGYTQNEDYITMDEWVRQANLKEDSDLLLQMDIEGFEYFTFINMTLALQKRFRIIVIELHSLHKLWEEEFFKLASSALGKILETHTCVHIHPNNCCGVDNKRGVKTPRLAEFTFLRNDRGILDEYQTTFPNPLDFDCTTKPTVILSKDWYHSLK
ncbi:MAG TPA: FkbM family methyltransferase [Daejeonella sp.]|uniref:FkbM family methyltransferase n=1 Tax=Daejeonella sp. TaxID=2805397 RepID=UPI002EDB0476